MKTLIIVLIGITLIVGVGAYFYFNNEKTTKNINPKTEAPIIKQAGDPTASTGIEEEWWTTCADNISIVYNSSKPVNIPDFKKNETTTILGGYEPSRHTYELFPQCVNMRDMGNYVDMACLTKLCSRIIQYNVLNGTTKEIWRKGQIW